MRKHTAAEMGKSRTPSQKWDKWASWETVIFLAGHVVKNMDCPVKSGTDGHPNCDRCHT